jgi:hypothetical protein
VKRALSSVVAAALGLTILSSCASVEPDAAKVGTHHIRIRGFEKRLERLSRLSIVAPEVGPGRISTRVSQTLLTFEINNALLGDELVARNLTVTAEEETSAADIAKQQIISSEADWAKLDAPSQRVFVDFVARQTKLRATVADAVTDDQLRAFIAAEGDLIASALGTSPGDDPSVFEQMKPDLKRLYAAGQIEDALVARAQSVKVDPRYGRYYPSTRSFESPEDRAAAAQQQAANGG